MIARSRSVLLSVLVGLTLGSACGPVPPPAPPPAGSSMSEPPPVASSTTAAPPPLLPMALHLEQPACGGNTTWYDTPLLQEMRKKGGSSCFANAGCLPPDPPWAGKLADCPLWPVQTIEDVVREARTAPAEQDVIVRGRLVLATGTWWPRVTIGHPAPCGETTLALSLEATVEGACYAIGIYPKSMMCDIDASRLCCDHLPLNQNVAFAGHLTHTPGAEVFSYLIDGILCRLPATAAPITSSPPASATPRTP